MDLYVKLLFSLPGLIPLLSHLVYVINHVVPQTVLYWLVRKATGFPDAAVKVTADKLLNYNSVFTALTMAMSEMVDIGPLDISFWKQFAPRTTSYWAEVDHWVSDSSREELIATARGMKTYKCTDGMPHAFCIAHSVPLAEKVVEWIRLELETMTNERQIQSL